MQTRRPKLLLADDSLTIQKVVALTFTDEGMEVVSVGTGEEAIRSMEESGPPDVLLADVQMPGMSGYEVCERVKQDARWQHVPVVLLKGAFEPFNEAEARRVGADEVLSKPFQSKRVRQSRLAARGKDAEGKSRATSAAWTRHRHEPRRRARGDDDEAVVERSLTRSARPGRHLRDRFDLDTNDRGTPDESFGRRDDGEHPTRGGPLRIRGDAVAEARPVERQRGSSHAAARARGRCRGRRKSRVRVARFVVARQTNPC